MTDSTQPEALRLAELLELAPEDGIEPQTAEDAAAGLRRLHSENETLQAGYAAARLEIESLEARIKTMAEEHADELMVAHLDGRMRAAQQPAPSAAAHVGDSLFESWFSEYNPAHRGTKQQMRDAYAAGMGDPKAQPSPTPQADSVLKDNQIAALVNELRDIAVEFHGTQQLRERIARVVVPALKAKTADSVLEDTARESEYRRGYRHGYEQRDAEVRGALA